MAATCPVGSQHCGATTGHSPFCCDLPDSAGPHQGSQPVGQGSLGPTNFSLIQKTLSGARPPPRVLAALTLSHRPSESSPPNSAANVSQFAWDSLAVHMRSPVSPWSVRIRSLTVSCPGSLSGLDKAGRFFTWPPAPPKPHLAQGPSGGSVELRRSRGDSVSGPRLGNVGTAPWTQGDLALSYLGCGTVSSQPPNLLSGGWLVSTAPTAEVTPRRPTQLRSTCWGTSPSGDPWSAGQTTFTRNQLRPTRFGCGGGPLFLPGQRHPTGAARGGVTRETPLPEGPKGR